MTKLIEAHVRNNIQSNKRRTRITQKTKHK